MKKIYKYPIKVSRETIIDIPHGAKFLTAQNQCDSIVLWALVDPDVKMERKMVLVVATGEDAYVPAADYLATVQIGDLVWHVFIS